MTIVEVVSRVIAGFTGLVLLGIAFFVYEAEEGAIQNRLEDWWIRIDELRLSAMSRQAAFIVQVSRLVNVALDSLFGKELLSTRALGASTCLVFASTGFAGLVIHRWSPLRIFPPDDWFGTFMSGFSGFYLAVALLGARWPQVIWRALAPSLAISILSVVFALVDGGPFGRVLALSGVGFTVVAPLSIVALLALVRRALRPRGASSSSPNVIGIIVAAGVPVLLTGLALTWFLGGYRAAFNRNTSIVILALVLSLGVYWSVLAIPGTLLFTLAVLMLLHRLVWPTAERPLYALARHGLIARRKVLMVVGFVLCTLAISPPAAWWAIIRKALYIG